MIIKMTLILTSIILKAKGLVNNICINNPTYMNVKCNKLTKLLIINLMEIIQIITIIMKILSNY